MPGAGPVPTVGRMCTYATRSSWSPPVQAPPPDPGLRIGDAERERASTELRAQFTAGRLGVDEFSDRLDEVWAATTAGDLQRALRELPVPQPAPPPPPPYRRRGPRRPLLAAALLFWLAWLLFVPGHFFWPIWPLAILGLLWVFRPLRRFTPPGAAPR
jgi:hypothetical protein